MYFLSFYILGAWKVLLNCQQLHSHIVPVFDAEVFLSKFAATQSGTSNPTHAPGRVCYHFSHRGVQIRLFRSCPPILHSHRRSRTNHAKPPPICCVFASQTSPYLSVLQERVFLMRLRRGYKVRFLYHAQCQTCFTIGSSHASLFTVVTPLPIAPIGSVYSLEQSGPAEGPKMLERPPRVTFGRAFNR